MQDPVLIGRANPAIRNLAKIVLVVDVVVMVAVGTFYPGTLTPDRVGLGLLFGCSAGLAIAWAMSHAVLTGSRFVATVCLVRRSVAVDTIDAIEMDGLALTARLRNGKKVDLSWSLSRNPSRQAEPISAYQHMLEERKPFKPEAAGGRNRIYPSITGIAVVAASGIVSVALTLIVRLLVHGQLLG